MLRWRRAFVSSTKVVALLVTVAFEALFSLQSLFSQGAYYMWGLMAL